MTREKKLAVGAIPISTTCACKSTEETALVLSPQEAVQLIVAHQCSSRRYATSALICSAGKSSGDMPPATIFGVGAFRRAASCSDE